MSQPIPPQTTEKMIIRLLANRQMFFSLVIALIILVVSMRNGQVILAQMELANRLLVQRVGDYFDSASRIITTLAGIPPDQTTLDAVCSVYPVFDVLYLVDSHGRLQHASPPSPQTPPGMDMSNQPFFRPHSAGLLISPPFTSTRTGNPTVFLSLPVKDGSGVIAGELNLFGLQEIISSGSDPKNFHATFLVDSSSGFIAHPEYQLVVQKEKLNAPDLFAQINRGFSRVVYFTGGALVFGVVNEAPQTGWWVVTQIPMSFFFSRYFAPAILGLFFTSLLFIVVMRNEKQIIARDIAGPLAALSRAAEQLARGDYAARPLTEISPAIREIASLTASFEKMKQAVAAREAALLESEERWQFAIEGPGDGVWDIHPLENRVRYSRAYKAMLGYSEDEFSEAQDEFIAHVHPDDRARLLRDDEDLYSGKSRTFISEFRLRKKDGSYIWVLSRGKVIRRDEQGRALRAIGTHVDITKQKETQAALDEAVRQLEQQNAQLEELNADKDKLFSIIAHDLRGPLTSFIAFGRLFESIEDLSAANQRQLLEEYNQAAQRIMDLLDNLLTWARSQRGHIRPNPETVSLSRAAQRNIELWSQHAAQKQLTLLNRVPPSQSAFADGSMVERVINNLLSNAVKFSLPGGCVEISARVVDQMVEVAVSDSGVGIPDAILANLFKVGVKSRQVGTAGEKGTGLGLILCKEFIEANGGQIWVESRVEQGAVARFTLPLPPQS